ncbi:hypothetical protein N7539_006648 [Penicillium diatomitis]|uniref:Uncharacterized protein n=1 Tax=Penicillium diatomitis TaxID=2819901 RepID=A0A9X0BS52_9EURO|nr:uncharacterized protein N7539_006648 [Penicillium diatomitis]KAJ5480754.1 hypothetical protein N7539_006648 [Penicillium diatomitis]
MASNPSPGNGVYPNGPSMRQPSLSWMYRLECDISKEELDLGAAHDAGTIRKISNIERGTLKGLDIEATLLPLGGADWLTVIKGTHSMTLDARYTARTTDGHYIYFRAHGLYRPGPGTDYAMAVEHDWEQPPKAVVTQDDVEFFSHLRLEAGPGPYNWVNGLICVGVMVCEREKIWIDAYRLTNFPDRKPESVVAKS